MQHQDSTGRTVIEVYGDVHDAERGYLLASAGPGYACHVEPEAPHDVGELVKRLSSNELAQNPFQDLSWRCTHDIRGGNIEPKEKTA